MASRTPSPDYWRQHLGETRPAAIPPMTWVPVAVVYTPQAHATDVPARVLGSLLALTRRTPAATNCHRFVCGVAVGGIHYIHMEEPRATAIPEDMAARPAATVLPLSFKVARSVRDLRPGRGSRMTARRHSCMCDSLSTQEQNGCKDPPGTSLGTHSQNHF